LALCAREIQVTEADTTDKLVALEQAREQLEAALAGDENWRALQQAEPDDYEDWSAARQARDTRLTLALERNSLYRAWVHVTAAIEALREDSSPETTTADPVAAVEPVADADGATGVRQDTVDDAIELPDEIREILRLGAAGISVASPPDPGVASPTAETEEADVAILHPEPEESEAATEDIGAPVLLDDIQDNGATSPPAGLDWAEAMEQSPIAANATEVEEAEIEIVEPTDLPGAEEIFANAAIARDDEVSDDIAAVPATEGIHRNLERREASVTFVRREPRAPLLPSADMSSDLGTTRKTQLFERLREVSDAEKQGGQSHERFTPPKLTEEAEVTIVTAEQARQRRFIKALSGD
jgi:hypothetical protein